MQKVQFSAVVQQSALILPTNKFPWSEDSHTGQLALSKAIHIMHCDRNYRYKQMNIYKLGHGE